ncbi:hypothetical protein [Hymenobacter koreensis]|uniref:Lipoprotein n=1 Tax=Hymenobacter koreensis TaxID=1084523 RepID=A0ABP8JM14_9BACT
MRKLAFMALATGILWGASCQKNDINPDAPTAARSAEVVNCTPDVIRFNNIVPGTRLTSATSDGGLTAAVSSYNPHYPDTANAAVVFRSSPTLSSAEDDDLGSPNVAYGGIGVGAGGGPGAYANTEALGNILVLHNFAGYPNPDPSNPLVNEPNDDDFNATEAPGRMGFEFSTPITATSITIIDNEFTYNNELEYGYVRLYASKGGAQIGMTYSFADAGPNGVNVLSLGNTPGVRYIEVTIGGSVGIDNLSFCRPMGMGCTRTQGYWKNHGPSPSGNNANMWPASATPMMLGSVSYTAAQLQQIFNSPVKGNGLVSLAHQLIAAKLNIAAGANGSAIAADIAAADAIMNGYSLKGNPDNYPSVPTSTTSALTSRLDMFNNGRLPGGPAHCN